MNTLHRILILFCLAVLPSSVLRASQVVLPEIPDALRVPADQQFSFALFARGVQIYECRAVPGEPGKYEWAFKAPEAELFAIGGEKVGRHYAGPTWELRDSKWVGKLKAKADAPDGKGIPWLLLEVDVDRSSGRLGEARSIQRVATVGGKPPAEVADASKVGQERRIEYTAIYVFYAAKHDIPPPPETAASP